MISITFSTDNLVDLGWVGVALAPLDSINSRTKGNVTKKIGGIVFSPWGYEIKLMLFDQTVVIIEHDIPPLANARNA